MKMAWQAHAAGGLRRTRFFTIRGGYHGDTFSPMSVCDPDGGMHSHVRRPRARARLRTAPARRPRPSRRRPGGRSRGSARHRALFEQHADEIAAVIVEPVLQGAGGMRVYPLAASTSSRRLAREHGALVIHDEIATGFWRTGTALGRHHAEERPDIVCVGKALTGGYLTLAAVLCTAEVAAAGERLARRRDDARPDVHGRTRSPARSPAPTSTCSRERRRRRASSAHRRPSCADGLAPAARARRGRRRPHARRRRRHRAATRPSTSPQVTEAALDRGRLGAAVPQPRLHDAAVRHLRPTTSPRSPTRIVGAVAEVHG